MPRRVLILHATGGMGHVKAAEAITAAFGERHPGVTVRNVNVLQFARPVFRFFYEDGYNFVSSHWTKFWGWLYRRYDRPARHGMLVALTRWAMEKPLLRYVREFRPDFIIGTHPMPTRLLAHVGDPNIAAIPTAVVVTDYGCHSFWVDEATDRYFVSTDEVRRCLGGFHVPPERVAVTGIPVQPKFARQIDRSAARRSLGLTGREPVVLVIGGLLTAAYLEQLVPLVRRHAPGTNFLLVTGRDRWLRSQLKRSVLPATEGVHVFGFVQNMEELLAACDVVITKAGGLTVSECLAMGAVMAIPSAIPGQEEDNLDFLLRHKVAVSAHAPGQLADAIAPLLTDAKLADERRSASRSLGKPNAAYDLAADVLRQIDARRVVK